MIRRNRLSLGSIILAVFVTLVFSVVAQDTSDETEDQIMAVSSKWDEAFNDADITQLMSLYAEDVVSMPPTLPRREGADALRADFEYLFNTFNVTHETTIVDIQMSDDLAVELGAYEMNFDPVDGSEDFTEVGKHVMVRREIDDEWKIVWEIWNTTEETES